MTDTEPGGKLYEAAMQQGADVAQKVTDADGPLQFNASEAESLRVILLGLQRELSIAQQTNYAIGAALYRRNLTIVHQPNDDGTFTVDLQIKSGAGAGAGAEAVH